MTLVPSAAIQPAPPYPCLRLQVKRVVRVTSGWARVVLTAPELAGFSLTGIACWIKVLICGPMGDIGRTYTVRDFDASKRELTIDVVRRQPSAGLSQWIYEHLTAGDWVDITGPKGGYVIGDDRDWHLFLGDETALPAMYRLLAAVPQGRAATAIAEVPFPENAYDAAHGIEFLIRGARERPTHSYLDTALETLTHRRGRGQVWIAGEASLVRRLKERASLIWAGADVTVEATGYWKAGHANYKELAALPS